MRIKVRNRFWTFRRVKSRGADGECDPPTSLKREIRVNPDLTGVDELDVILHELLHASQWDLAEEAVAEIATDISRVLWRLGYRKGQD